MEISSNFDQQVSELTRPETNRAGGIGQPVSDRARNGRGLARASALIVNLDTGNQPLELLYRTVLNKLSEVLLEDRGASVLRDALSSDAELNPKATAQRILTLATAYLPAYLRQSPDADDASMRAGFADMIGEGIEQGFAEAREILQGLGVVRGDIAADIDTTLDLVRQGLDTFLQDADPVRVKTGE